MSPAPGAIVYTPLPTYGVSFDGAHYLTLDSAAFNPETGHFGVGFLLRVNSAQADTEGLIIGKGINGLANAAGWQVLADRANRRLVFKINDGQAQPLTIYSSNNVFTPDSWASPYGELRVDRAGQGTFFINGAAVGGGSVAARPSSLDNAEPVRVGAYDGSNNRLNGVLGLLRFDRGRLLPDDYYLEEWDFLRFGLPRLDRGAQDFTAAWFFAQSLADSSDAAYTLAWQGGGPVSFVPGYPAAVAPVSYTFERHYDYGDSFGYLPPPESARAEDRTLRVPSCKEKRRFQLQFSKCPYRQWLAFEGARTSGNDLAFFEEANKPRTMWGRIMELNPKSVPYFNNGEKLLDFDLALEQV